MVTGTLRVPQVPSIANDSTFAQARIAKLPWYGLHVAEKDYDHPDDLATFLLVDGHRVGIQEIAFAAPTYQGVCRPMAKRARSLPLQVADLTCPDSRREL
jgi:hypothetical protein